MPSITVPHLGEREIRAHVGPQSIERAESYLAAARVFDTVREGRTLRALCEGQEPEPYAVWAAFDVRALTGSGCSCPVGGDGRCKHVAALLLTWERTPEAFAELETIESALARLDRPRLVELLTGLLARRPEVVPVMDALLGADRARTQPPADPRREAADVFRRHGYGPGTGAQCAGDLADFARRARDEELAGRIECAVPLHAAITGAVLGRYARLDDEDGSLRALVRESLSGLVRALAALPAGTAHAAALGALCDVFRFDAERGRLNAAKFVCAQLNAPERAREREECVGALREILARTEGFTRRVYESALLELAGDALDDATHSRLAKSAGRTDLRILRLVTTGHTEEARAEALVAHESALLELAQRASHGPHALAVEQLVAARVTTHPSLRLLEWLRDARLARGDEAGALSALTSIVLVRQELADYLALRDRARALSRWDELSRELRAKLASQGPTLLAEACLEEGDVRGAVAASLADPSRAPRALEARLRVARAAEGVDPRGAVGLYLAQAEVLVRLRGRANYREARRLLDRVVVLCARMGDVAEGRQHVEALRARHANLPTLLEELTGAGERVKLHAADSVFGEEASDDPEGGAWGDERGEWDADAENDDGDPSRSERDGDRISAQG